MKKIAAFILLVLSLSFSNSSQSKELTTGIVDRLIVEKHARTLKLLSNNQVVKTYKISLGRNPVGKKMAEGDKKTPEGIYIIDKRNKSSRFYKSLHISYPNATDIEQADTRGVSPGRDIMIHGLPNGLGFLGRFHLLIDWTAGCIAVTNDEINEIWAAVADGTVIEIKP